jgi:periplasmic protein TonB
MIVLTVLATAAAIGTLDNPITATGPLSDRLRAGNISDLDYPTALIKKRVRGTTEAKILINPAGQVAHCEVAVSSGAALLDQQTYALVMRRFRFRPFKNEAGQPAWGADVIKVHWAPPR